MAKQSDQNDDLVIKDGSKPSDSATVKAQLERDAIDCSLGIALQKARGLFYTCFLCVLLASCKKSATNSNPASPSASPESSPLRSSKAKNFETGPAKFDVCALLTTEEVQTIVGSTITQSSGSGRSDRNLRISQCVYVASLLEQSVSMVLTQADPVGRNRRSAKDFWRERFGRYQKQNEESKEESEEREGSGANLSESEEEEREGRPPRIIEHLGDEAYWTAGSLYVLHNESFLRLSLGGSGSEETKLGCSKALAEIALKRF